MSTDVKARSALSSSPALRPVPLPRPPRRAAWRQWLVEAERGMVQGMRSDSSLLGHFFVTTIVVLAALLLGLSVLQWAIVTLAITGVITVELLNQSLRSLARMIAAESAVNHNAADDGEAADSPPPPAVRIGTAAVVVVTTGALVTIGLILGERLHALFTAVHP